MKIVKIVVWDQLNHDKVIDMLKLSFPYYIHIKVMIGEDKLDDINNTIYIGYKSTLLNKNIVLDITDNQINNNCYWSFGYDEDRILFGKYLKNYVRKLVKLFFDESIVYKTIDYMFNKDINDINGIIGFIKHNGGLNKVFFTGLSYYFMLNDNPVIYNISLKMVKYFDGDNINVLIGYINDNCVLLTNSKNNDDYLEFQNNFNSALDYVLCERYYILFVNSSIGIIFS